jgi:hypothetical protein
MTASLAAPRVRLRVSALAPVLAALGFDEPRADERTSREIIVTNGEDLERRMARLAEQWAKELELRPPAPIPDDPPPHEGALIDIPYIIEPPDFLVVEVLEPSPAAQLPASTWGPARWHDHPGLVR